MRIIVKRKRITYTTYKPTGKTYEIASNKFIFEPRFIFEARHRLKVKHKKYLVKKGYEK